MIPERIGHLVAVLVPLVMASGLAATAIRHGTPAALAGLVALLLIRWRAARTRGAALPRLRRLRIDEEGRWRGFAGGQSLALTPQPGSFVLPSIACLVLRCQQGSSGLVIVRASRQPTDQWRRFRVLWFHASICHGCFEGRDTA